MPLHRLEKNPKEAPSEHAWRLDFPEERHERVTEVPVPTTRGTPHFQLHLEKNRILPQQMRPFSLQCLREKSRSSLLSLESVLDPPFLLLQKFHDIPGSTREEHQCPHHNSRRTPISLPHLGGGSIPCLLGNESYVPFGNKEAVSP